MKTEYANLMPRKELQNKQLILINAIINKVIRVIWRYKNYCYLIIVTVKR